MGGRSYGELAHIQGLQNLQYDSMVKSHQMLNNQMAAAQTVSVATSLQKAADFHRRAIEDALNHYRKFRTKKADHIVTDLMRLLASGMDAERTARKSAAALAVHASYPKDLTNKPLRDAIVDAVEGLDVWVNPSEDKDGHKREYTIRVELRIYFFGQVYSYRRAFVVESDSTTYNPLDDSRVLEEVAKHCGLTEAEWLGLAMAADIEAQK